MNRRFAQFLNKNPWTFAIIVLLGSVALGTGLLKLESDHSARSWFGPKHKLTKDLDQYEREFGNDQKFIVAIYRPSGVFEKKFLIDFEQLVEDLETIPDVFQIQSLKNAPLVRSENDEIELNPIIPSPIAEVSQQEIDQIKEIAGNDSQLVNFLTDAEGTTLIVLGELKPYFKTKPNFKKISEILFKKLAVLEKKYPDIIIHKIGGVVINSELSRISAKDLQVVMPLTLLSISLILIVSMGAWTGFLFPLFVLVLDVIGTLGLAGHLGFKLNNLMSITPGILISICIADTVHLMKTIKENSETQIVNTLTINFLPTLLTTITTAIGFSTLGLSKIMPVKTLGLLAAFGCGWAWVLSYFLFPLYAKSPFFKIAKKRRASLLDDFVEWIVKFKNKYPIRISIVFVSVVLLGLALIPSTKVNTVLFNYFKEKTGLVQSKNFFINHMKGLKAPSIAITAPKGKNVLDAEFLKRVEKFENYMLSMPYVNFASSFVDKVKEVNRALHNNDQAYYKVPDSTSQIADIHLLLTMSLPEGGDLKALITQRLNKLKIELRWTITETYDIKHIYYRDIDLGLKKFGLDGQVGGKTPIFSELNDQIISTFINSLSLSIGIIFIVLSWLFRSIRIGFISLLPNVIPICTGAIVMYGLDIYLDVGTVIVFSVCFGIAVDDTIHFLINYFENRKTLPERDAVDKTLRETGSKLIITTMTLVIGFGMFLLGDFAPNSNFGLLCVTTLSFALLTDLFFLPVLINFSVSKGSSTQQGSLLNEAGVEK